MSKPPQGKARSAIVYQPSTAANVPYDEFKDTPTGIAAISFFTIG